MSDPIPTISLTALRAADDAAIADLARACSEWGFFKLCDHGIGPGTGSYFDLPKAVKRQCGRTETNPWGYYDRELTKNRQDWKEIIDLGVDQRYARFGSRTPWPGESDGFQHIMLDWHARCEAIGLDLVRAICRSLGLDANTLTGHLRQ